MKATKTLAGALALTMLASTAVSFQVSAADASVTLKGAKVEAEAGGAFSVDGSLADIPSTKINVMDFAVTYDNTVLSLRTLTFPATAQPQMRRCSTPTSRTARSLSAGLLRWVLHLGSLRTA